MNKEKGFSIQKINNIFQLSKGMVKERQKITIDILMLSAQLQQVKENSPHKLPYIVNIFEHYDSSEPITSWAIAEIIKYIYENNPILVKSFAERFLSDVGFDVSMIQVPVITAEIAHIDVLIKEKNYAIIIENKLKGADYQRNQLARYIKRLKEEGYKNEQIYIVLLPRWCASEIEYIDNVRPSVWCLPNDYKSNNEERRCRHSDDKLCWCDDSKYVLNLEEQEHCKKCMKNYRELFESRTVVIHKELANWLINDCLNKIPPYEYILKSLIVQFADFLNMIYNNRDNKKLTEEMEKYLREQLLNTTDLAIDNWHKINQKIEEIDNLKKEMENLKISVSCDVIDEWYQQLKQEWPPELLKYEPRKSFGILIQDVWCGCWCGSDNGGIPYWGFRTKENTDREKKQKMVDEILKEADMLELLGNQNSKWFRWCNTDNGVKQCNALYNAAKKLGYLDF